MQLLLINKDALQVNETLSRAGSMIEQWTGPSVQKESLKVFFLVLQVCHYLTAGQVCITKSRIISLLSYDFEKGDCINSNIMMFFVGQNDLFHSLTIMLGHFIYVYLCFIYMEMMSLTRFMSSDLDVYPPSNRPTYLLNSL